MGREMIGGIAQLGERLPCKQEVSGSIPLISTYFLCKESKQRNFWLAARRRTQEGRGFEADSSRGKQNIRAHSSAG